MTTPSSILCDPGAVVLARIRFTEGTAAKKRPAVVLTDGLYHDSRADAIVVALSTQRAATYYGDCDLADWRVAGLPQPTKAKGVIQTIDRSTIERRLETLSSADLDRVKQSARLILCL
jgi:mRNA-degrading endonuclease toxin of MazEF toxin-antitoxin module